MRVVSLLPSATEILSLIGGRGLLVGRSHECDFPADVSSVPVLTAPSLAPNPGSGGVGGLNLSHTLDAERLKDLNPDLIIAQSSEPEGGAIDPDSLSRLASSIDPNPRVLTLHPGSLEDVFDDVLRIGEAVGLTLQARDTAVSLRGRVHAASDCVNPYVDGPRVGFMEQTKPICIAGHWNVQMIERAGGRHPLNETVPQPGSGSAAGPQQAQRVAGRSIAVTPEVFAAAKPEYLVIAPRGFSLAQSVAEIERYMREDWFRELPAVRAGRVAAVDGCQMFNRPGPRLVDAFEWLTGWINNRPELIGDNFPWRPIGGSA